MAKNEEEKIKLIDSYVESMTQLKKAAQNLWENLEKLDEVLTHPMGVFEDEIDEAEEEGYDWTVNVYSPFQDMEIHNVPDSLDEMIDILEKKKVSLSEKNKKDAIYRLIHQGNKKDGILGGGQMAIHDIYNTLREIADQSEDEFIRHMQKIAMEEQN